MATRRGRRGARRDWAQVSSLVSALTAVGALVFTALSLQATRDQIEIAERGQVTDRYSKAVEQLAHPRFEVRLGAVHALEQIARDSEAHRVPVVSVLTSFIRGERHVTTGGGPACEVEEFYDVGSARHDVHAALTAVGRLDGGRAVDLSLSCLDSALLPGARLRCANLDGSSLRQASLIGADLRGASLAGARLDAAESLGPDGAGAVLRGASLAGARLSRATLRNAVLEAVDLAGADLTDAVLAGADLDGANLAGAYVRGADFSGATVDFAAALRAGAIDDYPPAPQACGP
ncbi:pentapeptide repeat-containing protein [Saccharothrix variisporea]|uniref:pentapeptide repeat-containing protein n=1 Tax=Saccharothrix variisporea TaxID=543527 RepID=UPI0014772F9C|nr:pentapeptide repeat-containing protein [Saccharothrix variisporea]